MPVALCMVLIWQVRVYCNVLQVAEERLANMRTVRAFVQEHNESLVYNNCIDHVLQLSYREALARGFFWAMVIHMPYSG